MVDAFVRTHHVDGVPDPGRTLEPRPIPLLAQAAEPDDRATRPGHRSPRHRCESLPRPSRSTAPGIDARGATTRRTPGRPHHDR